MNAGFIFTGSRQPFHLARHRLAAPADALDDDAQTIVHQHADQRLLVVEIHDDDATSGGLGFHFPDGEQQQGAQNATVLLGRTAPQQRQAQHALLDFHLGLFHGAHAAFGKVAVVTL